MWYEAMLRRFRVVRKRGDFRLCLCPAHNDRRPSLSIWPNKDRTKLFIRCFAGCSTQAVLASVGITMKDLFEPTDRSGAPDPYVFHREIEATYDYLDEEGRLLYQKVRYRPKDFAQRQPIGNGNWRWGLKDVRRVLYHLPEILRRPRDVVLIVGGEKDADCAMDLGLLATCNTEGEGSGWDSDVYPLQLVGRDVVILPDNDEAGHRHAGRVAGALLLYGRPGSLKICHIPGVPPKGDLYDFVQQWGPNEKAREAVLALISSSPRYRCS